MKAQLLGQPFSNEDRLDQVLAELLIDADSLLTMTAWAQVSGMSQVEGEIRALRERGGSATAILGIDGGIATREGLELAVDLFDPALVFHDTGNRLFHPKIYRVERPGEVAVVVGSSNLTGSGLFANYEANVLLRLDPADPEDFKIAAAIEEYRCALIHKDMPCKPLTLELIAKLAEEKGVITTDTRRRKAEGATRRKAEELAREVFGPPVNGLPAIPRKAARRAPGKPVQQVSVSSKGPGAKAELRWWKRLTISDAVRKPEGSHQRRSVVLNGAGRGIEWEVWFRHELFGTASWSERQMQSGRTKEEAVIPFAVMVENRDLGQFDLRVDHAEGRIHGRRNAPTYLNWSSMIEVIRANDFHDWWLELARLTDGSFRLRLLREEPVEG
ncbi:MAG: hypothetical protein JWM24_1824 [Solirubrobacterales bacterium]|nr:hypothetical protein [Solirubrobacterales bacterium]